MSDGSGTASEQSAAKEPDAAPDPLAGDWSEGLPGPVHGLPLPKRLSLGGHAPAAAASAQAADAGEATAPAGADSVERDAARRSEKRESDELTGEESTDDRLLSEIAGLDFAEMERLIQASRAADVDSDGIDLSVSAAEDANAAEAAPERSAAAAAADPPAAADPAPTPWSDPVATAPEPVQNAPAATSAGPEAGAPQALPAESPWSIGLANDAPGPPSEAAAAPPAWDMPPPVASDCEEVVAAEDVIWSPLAASDVPSRDGAAPKAESAKGPEPAPAGDADNAWATMGDAPDWAAPAAPAAAEQTWTAAPPSAEVDWNAAPAVPVSANNWAEPPPVRARAAPLPKDASPALDTSSADSPTADASANGAATPAGTEKKAAPAWNAPAAGASALEQLEGGTLEAEPGAAQQLFGAIGGALSGENDDPYAPQDLESPEQFLRPVELASPEEFLKPIQPDASDPDLPAAVDAPSPPRMALAQMRPRSFGALEVAGEHRVAIHMRAGGTRRGTLRDVDLSKSSFSLLPQGGGAAEPMYHAEVKAIFFMLAPGEKLKRPDGGKVVVTFPDGRTIEGHRDGADAKPGFFLVPSDAARTNTRRIYIARDATSDIKDG